MTGFHIQQTIGGAWRLFDPLNAPIATFGDGASEQDALNIVQALNDAAEWPARARRAAEYIEQHIADMPCDDVPDALVCALMTLAGQGVAR